MTEREKTDFNRGDTNNEHIFKRGLGSAVSEHAYKKMRPDNQPGLNKQAGRGEKKTDRTFIYRDKLLALSFRVPIFWGNHFLQIFQTMVAHHREEEKTLVLLL